MADLERYLPPPPPSPPNPWKTSFRRYLADCAWTIDEARAGEVRKWPSGADWDDYWRDWETALLCCSPLLIDKTRRTMASNVVCQFDLWLASGGMDAEALKFWDLSREVSTDTERRLTWMMDRTPRWPVLAISDRNRKVIIQSQKLEDETGSAKFVERIGLLYREALAHGLRDRWPDFPEWRFTFANGRASNGSVITAVPQGADQIRGPGTTLLHQEELSFWEKAMESCETAIPSLRPFGHLVAVTTPQIACYAKDIRDGKISSVRE